MSVGARTDPLLGYNFLVSLVDSSSTVAKSSQLGAVAVGQSALGGFSECSGLEMTLEVEEYKEGGRNGAYLQFPTRVKWTNITLKRGIATSTELWDWHFGFVTGRGRRRDGMIVLQNDLGEPARIWSFRRGLPVKYTGPTLNASDNSVAVETVEIAHEGLLQLAVSGGTAARGPAGPGG